MTPQQIARQIEQTKKAHVTIYEGHNVRTNDRATFCTVDYIEGEDFNMNPNEASRLFLEFATDLPPGKYTVRLMSGPKGHNSARDIRMTVNQETARVSGAATDLEMFRKTMEEQLSAFKSQFLAEQEKKSLQDQVAELKEELKNAQSAGGKLDYLGNIIMDRYLGTATGSGSEQISGSNQAEESAEAKEAEKQIETALGHMVDKIGMDTVPLVQKLANIPEDKLRKLANLPDNVLAMALNHLG